IELTANHAAFARLGFRETGRTAHDGYARPTSITMRKALP
ncbi:GNAT family N-acetyltransferase, partial [Mesorhizobium sp. M7A.F.Ca.CA.003.01.2.1]